METSSRDNFIVKCVLKGINLPSSTRVGVGQTYTVQDLALLTVDQLRKIGADLEKAEKEHGGSRFKKNSRMEVPSGSGIHVSEWMDYILFLIEEKERVLEARRKLQELRDIESQLENLETPDEKKEKLKKRLAELKGLEVTA